MGVVSDGVILVCCLSQPDTSISAYTYERTLLMEQRNQMLEQMKLTTRQKRGDVQHLLGRSFSVSHALPSSPRSVQDISIPVPAAFSQSPLRQPGSSSKSDREAPINEETISVGELSVEPRVVGGESGNVQLIDLSSPYPGKDTLQAKSHDDNDGGVASVARRPRQDSESSSSSGEESAHTPLLETEGSSILPVMSQPAISRYDNMFTDRTEEEIPLGGAADNLQQQP